MRGFPSPCDGCKAVATFAPPPTRLPRSGRPEPQWVSHVQASLDETNTWTEINILAKFLTFSPMVSRILRGRRILVNWSWDLTVRYINTNDILAMTLANFFFLSEVVCK